MIPIRDEEPISTAPLICLALVAANLAVFLHEIRLPAEKLQELITAFGAIPFEISHFTHLDGARRVPHLAVLVSSQFLHGGWLHLIGNLLYLWTFGRRMEDALGRWRFLFFYLLCGIGAGLVQVAMTPDSRAPLIGASGAIAGMLGGYFVRFPFQRVQIVIPLFIFIRIVRVPAWIFLGLWFYLQWYSAGSQEGIAWYAHIGGFLIGIPLTFYFRKRKPARRRLSRILW